MLRIVLYAIWAVLDLFRSGADSIWHSRVTGIASQ